MMQEEHGDNITGQLLASLVSVWGDVVNIGDSDEVIQKAGKKIQAFYPGIDPAGCEKIGQVLLDGIFEGIGQGVSRINPDIESKALMTFAETLQPEVLSNILLQVAYGSNSGLVELVDRYIKKNRVR